MQRDIDMLRHCHHCMQFLPFSSFSVDHRSDTLFKNCDACREKSRRALKRSYDVKYQRKKRGQHRLVIEIKRAELAAALKRAGFDAGIVEYLPRKYFND